MIVCVLKCRRSDSKCFFSPSLRTAAIGRMSLWTAATKKRENLKAILYVFADCNDCVCVKV